MNPLLDIGNDLVAARRACGVSQRALGEAIGVKQQQIARWEATSYRSASLARIAVVADVLGFEPGYTSLAAEEPARYGAPPATAALGPTPVRDLGHAAARIRAHGPLLRDEYGVASVAVFGSFASGTQDSSSDVDLLVEFSDREKARGYRFVELGRAFEDLLGRNVDVAQPELLRERLRTRVLEEAIVVWAA